MQKQAFVLLAALLVLAAIQPAQARVWELGGASAVEQRFGIWDNDTHIFPIRGHVATFINPNLTAGAFINYGRDGEEYSSTVNSRTEIELGPRVGYYWDQKGFGYPFAWGRVSYGHIMWDTIDRGNYVDGHFTLTAGGGYMYLLNRYNGINIGVYAEQHWYDFYVHGWDSGQKIAIQLGLLLWIY